MGSGGMLLAYLFFLFLLFLLLLQNISFGTLLREEVQDVGLGIGLARLGSWFYHSV